MSAKVGYTRLSANCGLKVSQIILGCMSYGTSKWAGWVLEEQEAMKHFDAAWAMGINTFDTADMYSNGESEVLLGKWIKSRKIPREKIVVLSKCFMVVPEDLDTHPSSISDPDAQGYVNLRGLSRKHIFDAINASLKRLQLDYVDLYQCHRFDPQTPVPETMQALHDIVQAGMVRYIGMSSCYAYQFSQMQNWAAAHNTTQFVSMQNFYNAIYREEEREMMPTLAHYGVGSIPWSPLARGFLTRPHSEQSTTRVQTDPAYRRFLGFDDPADLESLKAVNEVVQQIAQARGVSMAQVALAWVRKQPGVSAPIVGSTKVESITELVEALKIELTDDEVTAINKPYRPRRVLGH